MKHLYLTMILADSGNLAGKGGRVTSTDVFCTKIQHTNWQGFYVKDTLDLADTSTKRCVRVRWSIHLKDPNFTELCIFCDIFME